MLSIVAKVTKYSVLLLFLRGTGTEWPKLKPTGPYLFGPVGTGPY